MARDIAGPATKWLLRPVNWDVPLPPWGELDVDTTTLPKTSVPTTTGTTMARPALTRSSRLRESRFVHFVPAVLLAVVIVAGLLAVQTPLAAILRYAAYLLLAVLLPGTLVHRALRGRNPWLIADLALGGATGIALGLVAWALFVLAGIQQFLWTWPLAVFIPFLAVPSLRRHWRLDGHTERSGFASWLLAGALAFYTLSIVMGTMYWHDLPPQANSYYADYYWQMANAAELTRQLPPQTPSVTGRTLHYHYFSSAHIAASHLISGVDLPTVMLRLWGIPVVGLVVGLLATVTRKATGALWPGAVAALILVAPTRLMPWSWFTPPIPDPLVEASTSQIFGLLSLLLAAVILVGQVRGEKIGKGGWAVLLLAAIAAPGSKPSVLPVLLGGLGCALVVNLLRRRQVRWIVLSMAMMGASLIVLSPLVAQSSAGSGLKLFGIFYFLRPWVLHATEPLSYPGTGGHIIGGLSAPGGTALALTLLAALLLQYLWVVAAIPLVCRSNRSDPAAVFLAGGLLTGIAALLLVDHPGASEMYFSKTAAPLGMILAAWGLKLALPPSADRLRSVLACLAAATVATVLVVSVHRAFDRRWELPAPSELAREIAVPVGALVAGGLVVGVIWWLLRACTGQALRGLGAVFFCAAMIAGFLVQAPWQTAQATMTAARHPRPPLAKAKVTADEARAARWLAANVPETDVVATNVHCLNKKTTPTCDSRAFWVAGLGERRMLVESWAYTEETLAQVGRHPGGFPRYPFDDAPRLAANELAFKNPTAENLAVLRDQYGVRWLFADRLAGAIAPLFPAPAKLRLSNGDVDIYELER